MNAIHHRFRPIAALTAALRASRPAPFLALLLCCALGGTALADDWTFVKELVVTPHRFDGFTVLGRYDGRDGTPEWAVVLERDGREVGRFENASAEQFYADTGHGVFIGVSNTGLPDTAVIVFDAHGTPIVHWAHGDWDAYCGMSVTIVRTWLSDRADAVFEYETTADGDVRLRDITLVGCGGERFSLDAAFGGEFAKALAAYRALPAVAARADAERDERAAACKAQADCVRPPERFSVAGVRGETDEEP